MTDGTAPRLGDVEYDRTTGAYYTNYATDVAPPSAVVPRALAEITDRAVGDLRPLQAVVDPDALDRLFDGTAVDREDVEVSFTYAGHDVSVCASGVVVIEPVEREP